MSQPAARVGDMHTCPMSDGPKPHVGGPILPPGVVTVLIGNMPAATVTSQCVCVSPAPDVILKGSTGVLIGGNPAARVGDVTAHGGVITVGLPTVLIGELSPVQTAILNARGMLAMKLKELSDWDASAKANAKKWMGDDSEATRKMLIERINKTLTALDAMNESNFKKAQKGKEKYYAYVYPNDKTHTVYLGNPFHAAPDTGTNSKAGTLVHEVSHFNDVAGTDDVTYGTKNSENLAKTSPSDAQNNADNFEYYIEN